MDCIEMRSSLRVLALPVLLALGTPAAGQVIFRGAVDYVDVDEPGAAYHGALPGDTVSATFTHPDTCEFPTCVTESFPPDEMNYVFETGTESWGSTLNGTDIGGFALHIAIQDDLVLDEQQAALASRLLGKDVDPGTVVDVWTVGGITDGADDTPLRAGIEVEFFFLSLDSSLHRLYRGLRDIRHHVPDAVKNPGRGTPYQERAFPRYRTSTHWWRRLLLLVQPDFSSAHRLHRNEAHPGSLPKRNRGAKPSPHVRPERWSCLHVVASRLKLAPRVRRTLGLRPTRSSRSPGTVTLPRDLK